MGNKNYWQAIACALLLSPVVVFSQSDSEPLKSDWLELVKGYRGNTYGAQVREIEEGETEGTQKITLAIPKRAISDPDAIEEVMVYGRKPQEREPLDISFEWLDDYDEDNYGLVIRLGKNSKWPIRLYMYSDTGFTR